LDARSGFADPGQTHSYDNEMEAVLAIEVKGELIALRLFQPLVAPLTRPIAVLDAAATLRAAMMPAPPPVRSDNAQLSLRS
jgi:hypothetical protein